MVAKGGQQARGTHTKKGTRSAPKFQHLPTQRARKLREEWVTKQKIKNAYRAQKRRGTLSLHSALPEVSQDSECGNFRVSAGDEDSNKDSIESASPRSSPSPDSHFLQPSEPQKHFPSTSRLNASSLRTNSMSSHTVHSARMKRKASQQAAPAAPPQDDKAARARDLFREAYSPASLHTFKSDPLHKRGSRTAQGGQERGLRNKGIGGTRGRGQPDMRKRMGALLAQIEAHK